MKRMITAAVLGVAAVLPAVGWAQATEAPTPPAVKVAADVPVKAVVLFSSGVGYFEHLGTVNGNAASELHFKTNQINDILKSLVLEDEDGGKVSTITYPSQDPVEKTLKSFQVDITGNPSLADLLTQLRGAKLTISVMGEKISGTVLGVEKRQIPGGANSPPVDESVLNVLTGSTIRQVEIAKITDLTLDDAVLQDELGKALAALAGARDQDKKPVVINFTGQGERRVRIGYVVETPVWKTSYRLILTAADAKPDANKPATQPAVDGQLQGWAIVENQTDNDWNNIQLSLVSGRPISFIQDLYQPLYIPRPVVQPELYASLRPQTYEAGTDKDREEQAAAVNAPAAAPAPQMAAKSERRALGYGAGGMGGNLTGGEAGNQPIDATSSIVSAASASQMGDLFEYTIRDPVTLPRQKSAMIPIITDPVEIEKVSIYNASVLPRNPLNGVRMKNTTGKHLLAGPVTVLEAGTYAGDAQVDNVPPGQERLLSYGIDLQVFVDSTSATQESQIVSGKIVKGVLQLSRRLVSKQVYAADNKGPADKALIIEHPIRPGWTLLDTPEPSEKTDTLYRFKSRIAAGAVTKLTVQEQIVEGESVEILPSDLQTLAVYIQSGEIPQKVRDALSKAAEMKQELVQTQQDIDERNQRVQQITVEQNRIRENVKVAERNSPYYARLLKELNDQETELAKIHDEVDDLQKKLKSQQQELDAYVNGLNIE